MVIFSLGEGYAGQEGDALAQDLQFVSDDAEGVQGEGPLVEGQALSEGEDGLEFALVHAHGGGAPDGLQRAVLAPPLEGVVEELAREGTLAVGRGGELEAEGVPF